MSKSSSRLTGIDLAYVIALLGTVAVSYLFVVGKKTGLLSHVHFFPLLDLFPALFLFLNGLTSSLMMRDAHISTRKVSAFLSKKGSILIVIGIALSPLWPLNIFIVCGLFYALAPTLTRLNTTILRVILVGVALLTISTISFTFIRTTVHYSVLKVSGSTMLDLVAFVFFNGYYSILPWGFFFLLGIIHGRGQVRVVGILQPSNILAIFWFLLAMGAQYFSLGFYQDREELYLGKQFPLDNKLFIPSFLFFGMASNILITNACIYMMKDWPKNRFRTIIQDLSSVKYSMYFFHLFAGIITIRMFNLETFGGHWGVVIYLVLMTFFLAWFSLYWKRKINELGPIEYLIKKIAGSTKS